MRALNSLIEFWDRHQRHLGLGALSFGFLFDLWFADRPDSLGNNILLLSYLFISASIILLLNLLRRRARARGLAAAEPLLLLLILQFCFGGLASNMLVLYGRSGTLAGGLIFLAFLLAMAIGNEFLRSRYALLRFNIAVYYMLLLSYCLIAVPTFILHYIGLGAFLISGLVSLGIMAGFLSLARLTIPRGERGSVWEGAFIVLLIFGLFTGAYSLQVIPPVPLSLKDIGIYHSITRVSGDYAATYEDKSLFEFWRSTSGTYHLGAGASAYCYSAVYAPAELSTPIYHRWERYDAEAREWRTLSRVAFPIYGGREGGYRGYTVGNLSEGRWRCSVETAAGALIGRVGFDAVPGALPAPLSESRL